jgi:hypothetical protein
VLNFSGEIKGFLEKYQHGFKSAGCVKTEVKIRGKKGVFPLGKFKSR